MCIASFMIILIWWQLTHDSYMINVYAAMPQRLYGRRTIRLFTRNTNIAVYAQSDLIRIFRKHFNPAAMLTDIPIGFNILPPNQNVGRDICDPEFEYLFLIVGDRILKWFLFVEVLLHDIYRYSIYFSYAS